jgi:hypothetical protein
LIPGLAEQLAQEGGGLVARLRRHHQEPILRISASAQNFSNIFYRQILDRISPEINRIQSYDFTTTTPALW